MRRGGLLQIAYRAGAADAVAGLARGSLRVRLSESPGLRGAPAGGHTFTGPGPYWVEAEVADRAGNVRRVRRALSWPAEPVARRLAWNDAFVNLRVPFLMARRHRHFDGHYRTSSRLARLLTANCGPRVFVALRPRTRGLRSRRDRRLERRAHAGAPRDRASGPPLRHGGSGRPGEHGGAALAAAQEVGALLIGEVPGGALGHQRTHLGGGTADVAVDDRDDAGGGAPLDAEDPRARAVGVHLQAPPGRESRVAPRRQSQTRSPPSPPLTTRSPFPANATA